MPIAKPIKIIGAVYDLDLSFPIEEGIFIRAQLVTKSGMIVERWESNNEKFAKFKPLLPYILELLK